MLCKKRSLVEAERQWKDLAARGKQVRKIQASVYSSNKPANTSTRVDPFECQSMAIPPVHTLVDRTVEEFSETWKQLDQRKVLKEDSSKLPSIHANRLRLPEGFDYKSQLPGPPEDTETGDRVISLLDPSQHLSYHRELWKLFQKVPTLQELEEETYKDAKLPHTLRVWDEITKGYARNQRLDAHALSRLRMSDRHGLPSPKSSSDTSDATNCSTTVRLECWTREPRRGSTPDSHRMQMEFLGSQTLQEVHYAIVECAQDDLWKRTNETTETCSGLFWIENVLYTTGSADYISPILAWLDTNRQVYTMGNSAPLQVKTMASTKLQDLEWRLGTRYYHVHHGDVEVALFLVDLRVTGPGADHSFPILHDVWRPSYPYAECEVCRYLPATVVVKATCTATDGGLRALCDECCRQLKVPSDQTEQYSVWRDQPDLSAGATRDRFL